MTLSGINTIGSLYTSNTAASSSSTTIIVPSLTPHSEKEHEPENDAEEKKTGDNMTDEKTIHPSSYYCHFHTNEQNPHDSFNDYKKSSKNNTYSENPSCVHEKPAATVIPIPVYMPTRTSSSLPRRIHTSPMSSSMTSPSSSPKKKAKRWMIAALMVIVGLLIALTFILIGLGKAISHHHQKQPVTTTNANPSPSHTTTTIFVVPTTSSL